MCGQKWRIKQQSLGAKEETGLAMRSVGLYFRAKRAENTDNAVHDSLNKKSIKLAGLGHDLALSHLFAMKEPLLPLQKIDNSFSLSLGRTHPKIMKET